MLRYNNGNTIANVTSTSVATGLFKHSLQYTASQASFSEQLTPFIAKTNNNQINKKIRKNNK